MDEGVPNPIEEGVDWVLRSIPVPPNEGVLGDKVNGVAPCEELLVRRVEGVNINEFARASPVGLGRVEGGVIAWFWACRRVLGIAGVGEGISSFSFTFSFTFSSLSLEDAELLGRPLVEVPDRVLL